MILITDELRAVLPPLYSQEDKGENAIVHAVFFDPCGSWTWFATEGSLVCPGHSNEDCRVCPPETWTDYMCFGLVDGEEEELGYFSLGDLQKHKGPLGLGVERNLYWTPRSLRQCRRSYRDAAMK